MLGDDGFGVEVARRLDAYPMAEGVEVADYYGPRPTSQRGLGAPGRAAAGSLRISVLRPMSSSGLPPQRMPITSRVAVSSRVSYLKGMCACQQMKGCPVGSGRRKCCPRPRGGC